LNPGGFELHTHYFVSGPRNKSGLGKDGKWHVGGEVISHSHPGGSVPHRHADTGPSCYGYRTPKVTAKPKGEQLDLIVLTEEESSFELIVTDSAQLGNPVGSAEHFTPIGNIPLGNVLSPAADRMKRGFRLKCIVRDERRKPPAGSAA
jgi:hypothetical protein